MINQQSRVLVLDQEFVNYPIEGFTKLISLSKDSRCDNNIHYLIFETETSKQVWCIKDKVERENLYQEYLKTIKTT